MAYEKACARGGPCRCVRLDTIKAEAAASADPPAPIPSVGSTEPSMAYYLGFKDPGKEIVSAAYHEAGHAIVNAGLGLKVESTRISVPAVTVTEYAYPPDDPRPTLLKVAVGAAAGRMVDEARGERIASRWRHDVMVGDALVSGSVPRCIADTVRRALDDIAREAVRDARGAIERVAMALCSEPYRLDGQQVSKLLGDDAVMLAYHGAEVDALAAALPAIPRATAEVA